MRINLLKTAAGLQEIDQLIERHRGNKMTYQGKKATFAYTRYRPTRGDEILETGGSIYWIMKNRIQVRQKILPQLNEHADRDGPRIEREQLSGLQTIADACRGTIGQ